jgi:hypothetical protein
MSDFRNKLRDSATKDSPANRPATPRGWEAGVQFDPNSGLPISITTPAGDKIEDGDWASALKLMNYSLPDGFSLRIANMSYDPVAWTRDDPDQKYATTKPAWRYKFTVVQEPIGQVISNDDLEAARARIQAWKLPQRTPGSGLGAPIAAVLNLADLQLGKPAGGGLEATEQRLLDGLARFQDYITRQRAGGRNINELVIVNNGDPYEGIGGNYAGQTFQVQANLRTQMNTVLDVWEGYARELFPHFDKGQFVSVLCNHTELGRMGSNKNQTDDADSGGAFLAESLKRILGGRPEFDHIEWTIPDDEMNVYTDIAGIPVAFNHGHKIPGNDASGFGKWLDGQVRGDKQAHAARIWITAHRHHFATWDMGSTTVFQAPSCDGGSKWLRDMNGKYSEAGILALLVGEHERLGWSDVAFL